MIFLDENVPASLRQALLAKRWKVQHIGFDLAKKGSTDEQLVRFLQTKSQATFISFDSDFYKKKLCHKRFCIIYLAVNDQIAVSKLLRILKHSEFNTKAKRMGKILRIDPESIRVMSSSEATRIIRWK